MILVADIQRAVASHYGLAVAELSNDSRARRYTGPRQLGMTLAYRLTNHSKARIASLFGKAPNSAFMAIDAVDVRMRTNAAVRNDMRRITLELVRR